jgi:hypothetical protein
MSTNQEHAAVKLVWYASYGSNLKRARFMCYIKGGTPPGGAKPNKGCFRDKTDPIEIRQISLNYELYFAGQSGTWGNGGVLVLPEAVECICLAYSSFFLRGAGLLSHLKRRRRRPGDEGTVGGFPFKEDPNVTRPC